MRNLKLYLADFDRSEGKVSYSIEDEDGNRVDKVSTSDVEKEMTDMDFLLLSYLPKLMIRGDNLKVMGPISKDLVDILDRMQLTLIRAGIHPFAISTLDITSVKDGSIEYEEGDIVKFAKIYLKNKDLNETLAGVFKYYE